MVASSGSFGAIQIVTDPSGFYAKVPEVSC